MIKQVNPHFKEYLFDWNQKFQFLVGVMDHPNAIMWRSRLF